MPVFVDEPRCMNTVDDSCWSLLLNSFADFSVWLWLDDENLSSRLQLSAIENIYGGVNIYADHSVVYYRWLNGKGKGLLLLSNLALVYLLPALQIQWTAA